MPLFLISSSTPGQLFVVMDLTIYSWVLLLLCPLVADSILSLKCFHFQFSSFIYHNLAISFWHDRYSLYYWVINCFVTFTVRCFEKFFPFSSMPPYTLGKICYSNVRFFSRREKLVIRIFIYFCVFNLSIQAFAYTTYKLMNQNILSLYIYIYIYWYGITYTLKRLS